LLIQLPDDHDHDESLYIYIYIYITYKTVYNELKKQHNKCQYAQIKYFKIKIVMKTYKNGKYIRSFVIISYTKSPLLIKKNHCAV